MIDWLLANYRNIVRFSRWILAGCALALLGLADLPHTPVNRLIAIVGPIAIMFVFLTWLAIALVTILRPRLFAELRRRRANRP